MAGKASSGRDVARVRAEAMETNDKVKVIKQVSSRAVKADGQPGGDEALALGGLFSSGG